MLADRVGIVAPDYKSVPAKKWGMIMRTTQSRRAGLERAIPSGQVESVVRNSLVTKSQPVAPMAQM